MSDDMKTPTLTPPNGNVEFTIGGHAFQVPVPSLDDGMPVRPQLMKVLAGSADFMEGAEQVIEVLCHLLPELKGHVTKDVLMLSCSLGEAFNLNESMRDLMRKSGLPIQQRQVAVAVPTAPVPAVWHPEPADDLAIPPRPVAPNEQAVITNFPSAVAAGP